MTTEIQPTSDPTLELSTAPSQRQPTGRVAGRGFKGEIIRAWRWYTSMRTALLFLALLALAAIPGSLIPQTNVDPGSVAAYQINHPKLGPLLQSLGVFNVFSSFWFAAIYLVLFTSLIGCLVPRMRLHFKALRKRPPHAPRSLLRMSTSTDWSLSDERDAAAVAGDVAATLRRKRWRVDVHDEGEDEFGSRKVSVSAEKGYLRETGNLLFHVALVLMLVGVAVGGLFGYKAEALVVQGSWFSNTLEYYGSGEFQPSWFTTQQQLAPFQVRLDKFNATYQPNNEPKAYIADVSYKTSPTAPLQHKVVQVNHPLSVDGTNVYLINYGYAINLTVRNQAGRVTQFSTPFIADSGTNVSQSHGVFKDPDFGGGKQLAFEGEFFSDFNVLTGTSTSPEDTNPVLALTAYKGNLGLNSGVPSDVYTLNTAGLKVIGNNKKMTPGTTWHIGSAGATVTFDGVTRYASFQVARDPGTPIELIAAVLILIGLTSSLRVRRRRFWVRASDVPDETAPGGSRTVVHAAGLTRSDPEGFAREYNGLVVGFGGPASLQEEF